MVIKNWLEIDGKVFNVIVTSVTENASILYSENMGKTISAGRRTTLDPLGTEFSYEVSVKRRGDDVKSYDELYDYVTKPRTDGFHVKIVHNQTTLSFDAYVTGASRQLSKIDEEGNKVYWHEMSVTITPMEAQVVAP